MDKDNVEKRILELSQSGTKASLIYTFLKKEGYTKQEIDNAFNNLGLVNGKLKKSRKLLIFVILLSILSITSFVFESKNYLSKEKIVSQITNPKVLFTNAKSKAQTEEEVLSVKDQYVNDKVSFIEADLKKMEITIYEDGVATLTKPILSKGKEGSWWETPTGNYKVLGKNPNGYSTIGEVWMPYTVQFYGNYLIHGWPHYDDGTPVAQGFSGGCLRLKDEDAKEIYDFAKSEMPILVIEEEEESDFGDLVSKGKVRNLDLDAKSFVISNLADGKNLVEKDKNAQSEIHYLSNLISGVVAHEVIYLGRKVSVNNSNLSNVFKAAPGEEYTGIDLLYPLMMQQTDEVSKMLANHIGRYNFMRNMNLKASSLEMRNTSFDEVTQGVSSSNDMTNLLSYIYFKRPFLLDISRGVVVNNVGIIKVGESIEINELENHNRLLKEKWLKGVKNDNNSMVSVWEVEVEDGIVPISIVILESSDPEAETQKAISWVKENYITK